MKKKILALILALFTLLSLSGCSTGFLSDKQMLDVPAGKNPEATIVIEYADEKDVERRITLVYELFYNDAPGTVANFVQLANAGHYNGKIFHNLTAGGITASNIQVMGGGKYSIESDGKYKLDKSLKYTIKGEFEANGWTKKDDADKDVSRNTLTHEKGSLVMDRDGGANTNFDTATADFYIALNNSNSRQGNYAVFGQLLSCKAEIFEGEGEDAGWTVYGYGEGLVDWFVNEMLTVTKENKDTTDDGRVNAPKQPITIKSITIDSKGVDYSKAKVPKIRLNLND